MRRTKAEAALTRQAILRSALAVFSTRGYSAARLEDVARLAGVTRGAVYWHFTDKPALFLGLLETYTSRITEVLHPASIQGGKFTEVLGNLIGGFLQAVETDRGIQAVLELTLFKTEASPELRGAQRRQFEAVGILARSLEAALRQAASRGEIRTDPPPEAAARVMAAAILGLVQQWLNAPRSFSLQETAPSLTRILLQGISSG
jgi:AcrR family transcriptional regulator